MYKRNNLGLCCDLCRNLQDPNAPVSTQGTSIKLLHSVVEVMFARHADRTTADSYRIQLGRILDVFVSKLSFMKSQIPKMLAAGGFCYGLHFANSGTTQMQTQQMVYLFNSLMEIHFVSMQFTPYLLNPCYTIQ